MHVFVVLFDSMSQRSNEEQRDELSLFQFTPATNLSLCSVRDSSQLFNLNHTSTIPPCVLYDVDPTQIISNSTNNNSNTTTTTNTTTFFLTIVQVTPTTCREHRDGSFAAVELLNNDNEGRGVRIGFLEDHHVSLYSERKT